MVSLLNNFWPKCLQTVDSVTIQWFFFSSDTIVIFWKPDDFEISEDNFFDNLKILMWIELDFEGYKYQELKSSEYSKPGTCRTSLLNYLSEFLRWGLMCNYFLCDFSDCCLHLYCCLL